MNLETIPGDIEKMIMNEAIDIGPEETIAMMIDVRDMKTETVSILCFDFLSYKMTFIYFSHILI